MIVFIKIEAKSCLSSFFINLLKEEMNLSFRATYIKKDTFFNKKNNSIILNINKRDIIKKCF